MTPPTSKSILSVLEHNKPALQAFGVKRIGLFGSAASGSAKAASDLDFVVSLDSPTFDNYMDLKFFLEKLFRRKIDLVTLAALKPALRHVKDDALYVPGL